MLVKGLNTDTDPLNQPKFTSPYIRNGNLTEEFGSITNERSTDFLQNLPEGYLPIGSITLDTQEKVLFLVNPDTNQCIIGKYNNSANFYSIVQPTTALNFKITNQIQATFKLNYKGERVVYFTDNLNPPRWINADVQNQVIDNTNVTKQNIFFSYKYPRFNLQGVNNTGGNLLTGTYQSFIAYVDENGNQTNWIGFSNWVSVTDKLTTQFYNGAESGSPSSKSITFSFTNLDTLYPRFRIGIIYAKDQVLQAPRIVAELPTVDTFIDYTYTGKESYTEISLEEVLEYGVIYETAKTLNQLEGVLYQANLSTKPDIEVQKYVNRMTLDYVTDVKNIGYSTLDDSYKDDIVIFKERGYQHDEVYAFYISFILTNGRETKAYHIPGRTVRDAYKGTIPSSIPEDTLLSNLDPGQENAVKAALNIDTVSFDDIKQVNGNARIFQLFDTSNNPLATSNMGYWENQNELYSDNSNWDIWGADINGNPVNLTAQDPVTYPTLRNKKVRHHKFPMPVTSTTTGGNFLNGSDTVNTTILGIQIGGLQLPPIVKNNIQAYKIYYAKRDLSNATVLSNPLTIPQAVMTTGNLITYLNNSGTYNIRKSVSVPSSDPKEDGPTFLSQIGQRAWRCYSPEFQGLNIDIKTITHFKAHTALGGPISPSFNWYPDSGDFKFGFIADYANPALNNYNPSSANSNTMRRVRSIFYTQNTVNKPFETNFVYYNTTKNIYNYQVDNSVFVEFYTDMAAVINGPTYDVSNPPSTYGLVWPTQTPLMLACSYTINIYNSFDAQELAFTGLMEDINAVNGILLFGGDVFVGNCCLRSTSNIAPIEPVDQTLITSLSHRTAHFFVSQSTVNINFRYLGVQPYEIYYPAYPLNTIDGLTDPDLGTGVLNISPFFSNVILYNQDYSRVNDTYQPVIQSKELANAAYRFPTRIIRSDKDNLEGVQDNFRQYLPLNYVDLQKNRGQIENLQRSNDNLYIQLTNSITRTVAREVLKTEDTNAFLGSGDIFAIPVKDIVYSDIGYGGTRSQWASLGTPFGLIYPDSSKGKVYLVNEGIDEISSNGRIKWFLNNGKLKLVDQMRDEDYFYPLYDNPANPNAVGHTAAWDEKYRRYILTKKDYEMRQTYLNNFRGKFIDGNIYNVGDVVFSEAQGSFYRYNGAAFDIMLLTNSTYFIDRSVTTSYYPELKCWGSIYDYKPGIYSFDNMNFYSYTATQIFRHNSLTNVGRFYFTKYPFEVDIVYNNNPDISKQFSSISYASKFKDFTNNEIITRTFDKFYLYNSYQVSGSTNIINLSTARLVNNKWNINQFRNIRNDYNIPILDVDYNITASIDLNKPFFEKERFSDKYTTARLTYDNQTEGILSLLLAETFDNEKER